MFRSPFARRLALGLILPLTAACAATPVVPPAATPTAPELPAPTEPEPVLRGELAEPSPAVRAPASPALSPSPAPSSQPPAAAAQPFAFNLFRRGDFVPQYTFEWCVGASIQMALTMTDRSDDRSRARQRRLWEMARDRSFSPYGGANPRGWVAVLNELGAGPYELVSVPDRDEALRVAAAALVATRRPVGLVMWRGRHAWLMSGFESRGDPRAGTGFDVTGVRVLDPLFPHGSRMWGRSPRPNELLTPDEVGRQFIARTRANSRVNLGVPDGYLLVLPTAAA